MGQKDGVYTVSSIPLPLVNCKFYSNYYYNASKIEQLSVVTRGGIWGGKGSLIADCGPPHCGLQISTFVLPLFHPSWQKQSHPFHGW